jgi:hypothetical protein
VPKYFDWGREEGCGTLSGAFVSMGYVDLDRDVDVDRGMGWLLVLKDDDAVWFVSWCFFAVYYWIGFVLFVCVCSLWW